MKICSVVLELLHSDRWKGRETNMVKLTGTLLQLFVVNVPTIIKQHFIIANWKYNKYGIENTTLIIPHGTEEPDLGVIN